MKGTLIIHTKVREDNGNIVEIKLWKVLPSADKPHGYKYSLAYVVKDKRVIGYDNGEGQGDHRHYEDNIEPYKFDGVVKSQNLRSFVIPTKVGIQSFQCVAKPLDSRFHGNDDFLRDRQI